MPPKVKSQRITREKDLRINTTPHQVVKGGAPRKVEKQEKKPA